MRFFDLISLIVENLNRRKGRVILTAIGVVIGTAAVVVLISLANGLQQNATSQFGSIEELTQIRVNPNYSGPVMVEKMGGGGGGGGGGNGQPQDIKLLTPDVLTQFAAIEGVSAVIPRDYLQVEAQITYGKLFAYGNIIGIGTNDVANLGYKTQSGITQIAKGSVVIGQGLLKNFMDPNMRPGDEPPAPVELQDQEIRLVLIKWVPKEDGNMIQIKKQIRLKVVGVIAETRGESDYSMYMSLDEVTPINEWAQGRRINRNKDGYNEVMVKVADRDKVVGIADQITQMGYMANTAQTFLEGVNSFFLVLQVVFGGVGAVALLVAAIGIANTMTMAILERTREIGLMKAVGATNRDVLMIFLGEAAGIGFIGGALGTLSGWGAGKLIDVVAVAYLTSQSQGGMPTTLAVVTPPWLPLFALIFATLVGLLSGLYPALRAAILVPVNALKYE